MSNWSEQLSEINLHSELSHLVRKGKIVTSQLRYSKEIILEWHL